MALVSPMDSRSGDPRGSSPSREARRMCPDGDGPAAGRRPSCRGRRRPLLQPRVPLSLRKHLLRARVLASWSRGPAAASAPGRRFGSIPPLRAPGCAEDGSDCISCLPDDLLLQVLARLRCARAAARTSLLSRRWRGLWRYLPELIFLKIVPAALDAALARVARTDLSLLDINVYVPEHYMFSDADLASLLRTAARLAPAKLILVVRGHRSVSDVPIELPLLHRTRSLKLDVCFISITMPVMAGVFPVLESLSIDGCDFDISAVILQCPQLRVLTVSNCWHLSNFIVHSSTIEELEVYCNRCWLQGIDVMAPVLKKFSLDTQMDRDFSMSFLAPVVEDLSLHCTCYFQNVGIGEMWRLRGLDLRKKESVYVVTLDITNYEHWMEDVDRNLMQEIAQLPDFDALELYLYPDGHVFGAMVLHILGTFTDIRRLKLYVYQDKTTEACRPNCPCAPKNWRTQKIPWMGLQELEIEDFEGSRHEVDLLKHLHEYAPFMRRVTLKLSRKASRNHGIHDRIPEIFGGNPLLELNVHPYRRSH